VGKHSRVLSVKQLFPMDFYWRHRNTLVALVIPPLLWLASISLATPGGCTSNANKIFLRVHFFAIFNQRCAHTKADFKHHIRFATKHSHIVNPDHSGDSIQFISAPVRHRSFSVDLRRQFVSARYNTSYEMCAFVLMGSSMSVFCSCMVSNRLMCSISKEPNGYVH